MLNYGISDTDKVKANELKPKFCGIKLLVLRKLDFARILENRR